MVVAVGKQSRRGAGGGGEARVASFGRTALASGNYTVIRFPKPNAVRMDLNCFGNVSWTNDRNSWAIILHGGGRGEGEGGGGRGEGEEGWISAGGGLGVAERA